LIVFKALSITPEISQPMESPFMVGLSYLDMSMLYRLRWPTVSHLGSGCSSGKGRISQKSMVVPANPKQNSEMPRSTPKLAKLIAKCLMELLGNN